jgi:hypothetical protein
LLRKSLTISGLELFLDEKQFRKKKLNNLVIATVEGIQSRLCSKFCE